MEPSHWVSLVVSLVALAGVVGTTFWREHSEDARRKEDREAERKARQEERELDRERRWLERKLAAYTEYLTHVTSLELSCGDIQEGRLAARAAGPSETLEALFISTEELGLLVSPSIHQKLETLTFACASLLFHSRQLAQADLDGVEVTTRKTMVEVIKKIREVLKRERHEFKQLAGKDLGAPSDQPAPEGS